MFQIISQSYTYFCYWISIITTFFATLSFIFSFFQVHATLSPDNFGKNLHHFFCNGYYRLVNIFTCFCTYFKKLNVTFHQKICVFLRDLNIWIVAFIDETKNIFIRVSVLLRFLDPKLLQIFERFETVDIAY